MREDQEHLTPEQRRFAHVMFQNRIFRSTGQRFEDFFVAIMTQRDPRFRPVKPQGRIGDQGNDEFIPEEGRYFQVFAPEDPTAKADKAAEKARDDFDKLRKHWEAIPESSTSGLSLTTSTREPIRRLSMPWQN